MVAVIHAGKSVRHALHYNEQKVSEGKAVLIHSMYFGKDTEQLLLKDKIGRLEKLVSLNKETKTNSLHISLNFDPSESLTQSILKEIADDYMQQIGFGNQPYLVYEHRDAGHPHLHIVTTNIQSDGSRIHLHNIGRIQSEKARLNIERKFGLVPAQKQQKEAYQLKPVNVQKAQYGKSETKRAITNVLDAVLPHYKYTSLAELNAVLKQYNVVADRGSEESRTYKRGGLVYRMLDERGEKIGVPIKASLIDNKPTLAAIGARFAGNNEARQKHKQRVKNAVDLSFLKHPKHTLQTLRKALQKEQIELVLRQKDPGTTIYGLTYIDYQTKCVFNGSDLGKQYSATAVQQRCSGETAFNTQLKQTIQPVQQPQNTPHSIAISSKPSSDIIHHLTAPDAQSVDSELMEEKKRKKKKQQRQ